MSEIKCSVNENVKRKHVALLIMKKVQILKKLDSGTSVNIVSSYKPTDMTLRKTKKILLKFFQIRIINQQLGKEYPYMQQNTSKQIKMDEILLPTVMKKF